MFKKTFIQASVGLFYVFLIALCACQDIHKVFSLAVVRYLDRELALVFSATRLGVSMDTLYRSLNKKKNRTIEVQSNKLQALPSLTGA